MGLLPTLSWTYLSVTFISVHPQKLTTNRPLELRMAKFRVSWLIKLCSTELSSPHKHRLNRLWSMEWQIPTIRIPPLRIRRRTLRKVLA